MPRKDSSFNNREKKKNSKKNKGKNIYSSKHVRMQAAIMNKSITTPVQETPFKNKRRK